MADVNQSNGAPAQEVSSAPDTGVNWGDLDVDVDGGAYVEEPAAPVVEQPAQPVQQAPAQTPSAPQQQQPVQGQQQQPTQAPQTPAASPDQQSPTQQPQQAQPQQATQAPADPVEIQRQWRAQLEADFAINDDDALALSTAPETVMPKLAANMYQRIMQDVMQQFKQFGAGLPTMMQQYVERTQAEAAAKQEFYGEWPGLAQHHDRVLSNALLVRQANPQATRQQVIEMAGMMTAMSLGVDPATLRKSAGAPGAGQPQRAFQPVQAQVPVRPAGLTPAQGTGLGEGNLFADFANEDMDWLQG